MLYGFVIIIVTMVGVTGVLGQGLVMGILYVLALIMEVFVTGMLNSFGNENSKRFMSCSYIGMGLVTYYIGLVMIQEGIDNGNVMFLQFKSKQSQWQPQYGDGDSYWNIIEFCFSINICQEIYEALIINMRLQFQF